MEGRHRTSKTSKFRNIAIADIETLANMSLSTPDQLAKPGYGVHALGISARGMRKACFARPLRSWPLSIR